MEEIIWTNQAYEHLHLIHKFLTDTINEEIADKTVTDLLQKPEVLKSHPNLGQIEERLNKRSYQYRYLIDGHYKIIYFVDQTKIVITAVFDCRQHPSKLKI